MALDNLAVEISSQTADVQAGLASVRRGFSRLSRDAVETNVALDRAGESMDDARDDALGLAYALGRVDEQADDAGRGMLVAGGEAATGGSLFSTAAVGTHGLSFSLGTLSTTIIATAIPALVALSTTLVPLTATIGGLVTAAGALAGAFGLVAGSGLVAFTHHVSDLETALSNLRAEVEPIIVEFGEQFVPLIRDAIRAVPQLVRDVLAAVGGLGQFEAVLRQLGQAGMRLIPMIAGELADLAREALPVLVDGLRWLRQNGGGIFDGIMRTTRAVAPLLQQVGSAVVDALPAINRFGTAVLSQLLPAVADGIRGFGNLLERIMAFTQTQQFRDIMAAVRTQLQRIGPELTELGENFDALLQTLIENGPAIIRGIGAVADTVLDVVNAIMPLLRAAIDLAGRAGKAWSNWVQRSERQEQRLAQGDVLGGVEQFARTTFGGGRGVTPTGRLQEDRELRIRVETNDDRFDAYVDDRVQTRNQELYDDIERGSFRGD